MKLPDRNKRPTINVVDPSASREVRQILGDNQSNDFSRDSNAFPIGGDDS